MNGAAASPPKTNGTSNHRHFPSSSEESYGAYGSHSRSASGTSQTQYDDFYATPPRKALVQEFARSDVIMNGQARPGSRDFRRSMRLRQSDPMAMHLLIETALGDSQHYDLLNPDELESLKKEEQLLQKKIQARRKKLYFESKLQNTSRSLRRLDLHARVPSDAPPIDTQKCDELAEDIWKLERKQAELQDKRLKHTAGVLQLNHQLQLQNDRNFAQESNGYGDDDDHFSFLDGAFDFAGGNLTPRLQDISESLYNSISESTVNQNLDFPEPPTSGGNADDLVDYIEQSLNAQKGLQEGQRQYLDNTIQKARSLDQTSQQTSAVLAGLWEIIGSGEEDLKRNKQAIRDLSSTNGTPVVEEPEDESDPSEPFSIQAFSARIQKLCEQAATLSDQQLDLHRQLQGEKQAHEQKTTERSGMLEDLQNAHDQHLATNRSLEEHKAQLMEARGNHDQAIQELQFLKQQQTGERDERSTEVNSLRNDIDTHQSTIRALHLDHTTTSDKLRDTEVALADKHKESEELEAELVRLQTELTVSRAELDGAYGTRAQRAAEGALTPEIKKEMDDLRTALSGKESRMETLERELGDLVGAHESIVRQNVGAEKEREQLEALVDGLKERIEESERALTDHKVGLLGYGAGTPGAASRDRNGQLSSGAISRPGSSRGGEATSVSVMRNEFKKMTRDLRAEHFRAMKAEQDERRRLEAQIRSLKGSSAPSSAALSPPPRTSNLS